MIRYLLLLVSITLLSFSAKAQCDASFAYTTNNPNMNDTLLMGNLASFTPISIGPGLAHYWKLNNGPYSLQNTIIYTFNTPGVQTVCQVIVDSNMMCTDTFCTNLYVKNCLATFSIYPDTNGPPHTYIGVNNCIGNNLSYYWTWGDGSNSIGAYPSHTYGSAGNYNICVMINDGGGCLDTFCSNQTINKNTAMYSIDFNNAALQIKESELNKMTVIPNPATDYIILEYAKTNTLAVRIYSMDGRQVLSQSYVSGDKIDISRLPSNIYFLRAYSDESKVLNAVINKLE